MMEGSPQYHLLNGPTRADVGKSEGGSKQIASPRQTQGRCGELMNIFLRGKKQSRQSRALRQEVAMKFKVTMNLFVEPSVLEDITLLGACLSLLPQTCGGKPFS